MLYIVLSLLLLTSTTSELLALELLPTKNSQSSIDQEIATVKQHLANIQKVQEDIRKNPSLGNDDKSRLVARTNLRIKSLQALLSLLESTKKISDLRSTYKKAAQQYRDSASIYLPLASNKLVASTVGQKNLEVKKKDYTDSVNTFNAAYSALTQEQNNNNNLRLAHLTAKHSEDQNDPVLTAQMASSKANTVVNQLAQQVSDALVASSAPFENESAF